MAQDDGISSDRGLLAEAMALCTKVEGRTKDADLCDVIRAIRLVASAAKRSVTKHDWIN